MEHTYNYEHSTIPFKKTEYNPKEHGVVEAIRLFLIDGHIPYAELCFTFGGTITLQWDIVSNRLLFGAGINAYTLYYDERTGKVPFEVRRASAIDKVKEI